jgi:hypothetical protein
MAKLEFEIVDHGADHAQYFQGAGVMFSRFTDIATGVGDTPREALENARQQVFEDLNGREDLDLSNLDAVCDTAKKAKGAGVSCHESCECEHGITGGCAEDREGWHDECEIHCYVSIRWLVQDEVQAQA